jgi:hypothetical protein
MSKQKWKRQNAQREESSAAGTASDLGNQLVDGNFRKVPQLFSEAKGE